MELFQPAARLDTPSQHLAAPPFVARFSPVFWEPVPGTGERVVALIAVEPHAGSKSSVSPGTYCVLPLLRLRALLGTQRGTASHGVLRQAAEFMTTRQQAGIPLDELEAPFHGFIMGPQLMGRGYSIDQLLDAAVRSVSAFGSADALVDDETASERPRHTIKTQEFLQAVRRQVAGDDPERRARFEKSLQPSRDLPELTVDYAWRQWLLQVTSLPGTKRQSMNTLRESQSKLYEIDVIRRHMEGNAVKPVLLINTDTLNGAASEEVVNEAMSMLDRLLRLAKAEQLDVIEAASPMEAAEHVNALQ